MASSFTLQPPPPPVKRGEASSLAMAGFWDRSGNDGQPAPAAEDPQPQPAAPTGSPKTPPATETLGKRAGSLSDELDFPTFVSSLIHGTWDAMVDSSIRQMDSFGDLVAAISKPLAQFRDENVSPAQARDWLAAQYPGDLRLAKTDGGGELAVKGADDQGGSAPSPEWLAEFGLASEELTPDLIEEKLIPVVRDRLASDRMQTLATLVTLGMNRIIVRDGTITARVRMRAAATDKANVDYAISDDPNASSPRGSWSTRGSTAYAPATTKVSTVGVNAQTDTTLNAELFGEVKINFASETLPLDRFVDDARRTLLERAAKPLPLKSEAARTAATPGAPVAPPAASAPAVPPTPAAPAPAPAGAPVA